jgi:hypothetical protein
MQKGGNSGCHLPLGWYHHPPCYFLSPVHFMESVASPSSDGVRRVTDSNHDRFGGFYARLSTWETGLASKISDCDGDFDSDDFKPVLVEAASTLKVGVRSVASFSEEQDLECYLSEFLTQLTKTFNRAYNAAMDRYPDVGTTREFSELLTIQLLSQDICDAREKLEGVEERGTDHADGS